MKIERYILRNWALNFSVFTFNLPVRDTSKLCRSNYLNYFINAIIGMKIRNIRNHCESYFDVAVVTKTANNIVTPDTPI